MISSGCVRVDINNADVEGYIRLNCNGTISDVDNLGIVLEDGLSLMAHDGEIEFHGFVRLPGNEAVWRLEVDWRDIFAKHANL